MCCLLAAPMAEAQSKKSAKQTASLEKAGEASKAAAKVKSMLETTGKTQADAELEADGME